MQDQEPDIGKHPRGTLAIVAAYGVVFVLAWLAFFFFVYLPRGPLGE